MNNTTNTTKTITIHTIARNWLATDVMEEGIAMDRQQMAAQLRRLLKLSAEPKADESVPSKVWEEKVAGPFRAEYRLAYIARCEKQGVPAEEKLALTAARVALFSLKKRAGIVVAKGADKPETKVETKAEAKATPAKPKTGRPPKLHRCPCCEAVLIIANGGLAKAPESA